MIKSGGEWISSVDLEDVLLQHDAVAEIAVIAIDDPAGRNDHWRLCAANPVMTLERLRACGAFLLQSSQVLGARVLGFSDDIPKTSVGKIDAAPRAGRVFDCANHLDSGEE